MERLLGRIPIKSQIGDEAVRVPPELGGGKVKRDDFTAVEIADEIESAHGVTHYRTDTVGHAAVRRKRLMQIRG